MPVEVLKLMFVYLADLGLFHFVLSGHTSYDAVKYCKSLSKESSPGAVSEHCQRRIPKIRC